MEINLKVRNKTITLTKENTEVSLYNIELGNGFFLDMTPKAQ